MKKIFLLLFVIISLSACKSNIEEKNAYTTFNKKVDTDVDPNVINANDGNDKLFFGIMNQKGEPEIDGVYYLDDAKLSDRYITIGNYVKEDREYSIMALVNYRQSSFCIENEEYLLYSVFIEKNKDLKIPIEIKDLNHGTNEILFLIIPNAKRDLTEEERVERGIFSDVYHIRCKAIVGNESAQNIEESNKIETVAGANTELCLSTDHTGKGINMPFCKLDKSDHFYLTVGNINETETEYMVIVFDNWEQVPFYQGRSSLYINLPGNTQTVLPVDIDINKQKEHELVAIALMNPYGTYDFHAIELLSSMRMRLSMD